MENVANFGTSSTPPVQAGGGGMETMGPVGAEGCIRNRAAAPPGLHLHRGMQPHPFTTTERAASGRFDL